MPWISAAVGTAVSARGEFAATARGPPARGELQALDRLARLDLFEHALVARAPDAPRTVVLRVLVLVERAPTNRKLEVGHHHHVIERPHAGRGVRAGQIDLRMVHLVARS